MTNKKLDAIRLAISRLFLLGNVWTLFFLLFYSNDFEESHPNLPIIIIFCLSFYVIGEIILLICELLEKP